MMPALGPHRSAGASPDGIGAYLRQPADSGPMREYVSATPTTHYENTGGRPVGGELAFLEPRDTSGQAAVQSAGFTAVLVAVGVGAGALAGGGWGAGAGLMLTAAVANGYRAQKWMNEPDPGRRHEAVVSATFAVMEVALGSYLSYKAYKGAKS